MFLRLILLHGLAITCWAQQAAPAGPIKLNVTAGQGAVNNIALRVAAQPAVEVLDAKNAPVAGAEVIFYAPAEGPGGSFFGVVRTLTLKTDAKGQATASGFTPNDQAGKFQILVRATAGGGTAEAIVNQTNGYGSSSVSKASPSHKKMWIALAVVAAAAIGGGVAANNGSSPAAAAAAAKRPVSIGAGAIIVGGPR